MEPAEALEVLGLAGPVGPRDVKLAYRRLARELHPDRGGDAERFRHVQLAFETIRDGTDARVDGPRAQVRVAGVDHRWWETPGAWHERPVDTEHVDLGRSPDGAATRADVDLLASLLHDPTDGPVRPVQLHSRAPGSRLHRIVTWLQPDLLAALSVAPAPDGIRPDHDVRVELRASAGRGRRIAADATIPASWTRTRGTDAVTIRRDLRPSRQPDETAVRVAREVAACCDAIRWPLDDWFVLRPATNRPT